jgi:RimJ/RimL family protein N-acetyltransferase
MKRTTPIQTKNLTLVPHSLDDVRAQIEGMDAEQRAELSPDWLARVRVATTGDPWTLGFALVHGATNVVVGTCGFKGPPGADGMVEIAYGVSPDHQGKGYATEAAEALVAYAFTSGKVRVLRAHTFLEANASARVLAKCGFRPVGKVIDPEDGPVWRWEKHLHDR